MSKFLIVSGDQGDGIISAAILIKKYNLKMTDVRVVLSRSFLLDSIRVDDEVAIFIAGIGVNNKERQMTRDFAHKYRQRIISWIDHHKETEECLRSILNSSLSCDGTARCCPEVMKKSGYRVPEEWIESARAFAYPLDFPDTPLSKRYKEASTVAITKANEGDRSQIRKIQQAFLEELVSGHETEIISDYVNDYRYIKKATQEAINSFQELMPKVGVILLEDERVDKTLLRTEGYKLFPTLVMQFHSANNGEPMTIVSTNRKINLNDVFGIPEGLPSRITLPGELIRVRDLIKEKLS